MDVLRIHSLLGVLILAILEISCSKCNQAFWLCQRLTVLKVALNYNPNSTELVGNYTTVTCDDPIVQNKTYNAAELWNYVDGNTAWNDSIQAWTASPTTDFSEFILDFFNAPPADCGNLTSPSTCNVWRTCTDFKYPAGMLIYNQFYVINYVCFDIKPWRMIKIY